MKSFTVQDLGVEDREKYGRKKFYRRGHRISAFFEEHLFLKNSEAVWIKLFTVMIYNQRSVIFVGIARSSSNSSKQQLIKVATHQSGNSSKWQLIETATHRSGNSSKRLLNEAATQWRGNSSNLHRDGNSSNLHISAQISKYLPAFTHSFDEVSCQILVL